MRSARSICARIDTQLPFRSIVVIVVAMVLVDVVTIAAGSSGSLLFAHAIWSHKVTLQKIRLCSNVLRWWEA